MTKPSLAIISDIFGFNDQNYLEKYLSNLSPHFKITLFDSRTLGAINQKQGKKAIHSHFINKGIDIAIKNLLKLNTKFHTCIGFSVGGTIAFKACLLEPFIENLVCLSPTRVRFENKSPHNNFKIYFGENDQYKPKAHWLTNNSKNCKILENVGHDLYHQPKLINKFCEEILFNLK